MISQLLSAKEPLFGMAIKQLEDLTGHPGIDIRLSSEIVSTVRLKISQLNLDPEDTTGPELYQVLQNKLKNDDKKMLEMAGLSGMPRTAELFEAVKKLLNPYSGKKCWLLKRSVAKELIRKNPPAHVMEIMHYKSVDSMLKTENVSEIFAAMRIAETPAWLNSFIARYKDLNPSDFEQREIEILIMPTDRWLHAAKPFIKSKKHNVTHLKELGAVAVLPTENEYHFGMAITLIPLIVHYINEIKLYSSYFKLHQVKPDFAKIVQQIIVGDSNPVAIIAGQNIHWRILQRYYGKMEHPELHPEIFEPHVQPEDLHWRKAEDLLYEIDRELGWWCDLDYVGILDEGAPVTFNLMDNAISLYNQSGYSSRSYYHFRESLWNELFIRYMGEKTLENQILHQLDLHLIYPEKINRKRLKI